MSDNNSHSGIFPADYPTQRKSRESSGKYSGELRGFYPNTRDDANAGDGFWLPGFSQFQGRPGKRHGGIDIYAPFASTPLEQPVVALRGGYLTCRSGALEPNELGNRAMLSIKLDDGSQHLIQYGHLSRFEGRNRKVTAGAIIGYAGCSGNADEKDECTTVGDAYVNAGHIHLMRIGKEKWDPEKKLNLKLDPVSLNKKTSAAAWVDENTGDVPGSFPKWEEPDPDGTYPRVRLDYEMHWWREKGKPKPLPAPFTPIEFANKNLLESTHTFYKNCAKRLDEPPADMSQAMKKHLKDFFKQRREVAQKAFADRDVLLRLERLIAKPGVGDEPETLIGFDAEGKPGQYAEFAMRHLARLNLMLWYLCGGSALELLAANADGTEDGVQYDRKWMLWKKKAAVPFRSTTLPECGAGVDGTAWLSGCRHGCSAVHNTQFKDKPDDPDGDLHWIESVTFGAGSLRHATVSSFINSSSFDSEDEKEAVAAYLVDLRGAFRAVKKAHRVVHANSISLSGEAEPEAATRGIKAFVDAILNKEQQVDEDAGIKAKKAGALESIRKAKGHLNERVAKGFIPAAVNSNVTVFKNMHRRASEKEDGIPLSPVMIMAWAAKAPAPTKEPESEASAQEGSR